MVFWISQNQIWKTKIRYYNLSINGIFFSKYWKLRTLTTSEIRGLFAFNRTDIFSEWLCRSIDLSYTSQSVNFDSYLFTYLGLGNTEKWKIDWIFVILDIKFTQPRSRFWRPLEASVYNIFEKLCHRLNEYNIRF